VPGTLRLKFDGEPEVTEEIQVDFKRKEIIQARGHEPNVEFYAIEAVDQAELIYFILKSDVSFLTVGLDAYVQAKLDAIGDEDANSNGLGICESSLILYKVSSPKENKKENGKRKNVA
jgi:hypothetical protein